MNASEFEDLTVGGGGDGAHQVFYDFEGNTSSTNALPPSYPPLNIGYVICEVLVAVTAVIGNALTIMVFALDRKLRRLTNYYIVSLAMADLLVGMPGIPFAILTSIGIPSNPLMCLPMLSLLLMLCTVSIFCLVAVSVDRYWAILYPLKYSRVMTAKIARRIIMLCWFAGIILGLLPMMGWRENYDGGCVFVEVMDYDYLVFLYFSTIVGPGVLMAIFYTHIYTVVLKQSKFSVKSEHGTLRQIAAQEPQSEAGSVSTHHGGSQRQRSHFLTNMGQNRSQADMNESRRGSTSTNVGTQVTHASRREVKAAKSLSIIVLFFFICWFPLYTINCIVAFCKPCHVPEEVMFITITLTHVNSAVNPFLYAYHMKDFRQALKIFILQRILRRNIPLNTACNRSLVSPHHSTLYRVAVGGGSPQLTNFHTPHGHNTPLTSTPSPVAGTPGGLRSSRSSTLGSYGPWLPSTGMSPSASLVRTPEGHDEPLSRPRAATIITHTSPASARSGKSEGALKKPLLSASHLGVLAENSRHSFGGCQLPSLSVDAVTFNIDIGNDCDGASDITTESPEHQSMLLSPRQSNSKPELFQTENSLLSSTASSNVCNDPLICATVKSTHNCNDSSKLSVNSETGEIYRDLQRITHGTEKSYDVESDTQSNGESQDLLSSDKCCSPTIYEKCSCEISISCVDDGSAGKETNLYKNTSSPTPQENNRTESDTTLKASNGRKLAASKTLTSLQIPNGTEDITSSPTNKTESALNCLPIDYGRKGTESVSTEATSNLCKVRMDAEESSHLTQEFYKYLPKILRRKDESKKSKNSRTGKGWFSNMMRHRSYHGITLELAGSKQLPRAQSISGAMET